MRVDLISCYFKQNDSAKLQIYTDPTDDDTDFGSYSASASLVLHLALGDTLYLGSCSPLSNFDASHSVFSGFLIRPDTL